MAANSKVGIFWDYENCPPPSSFMKAEQSYHLVNCIRAIAKPSGIINYIRAYQDTPEKLQTNVRSMRLRSELSSVGVEFLECPHERRKEVVDKRIIVDMCLFASDSTSPVTIVLITGDGDYTYAVSKLIDRHHKVIVVAHEEASLGLKCIASQFLVWGSGELEFLPRFPQDSPNHASIHKRHGTQHEPLVYSHFDEGSQFSSTAPAVAGEILPHEPNFETALSPTDCSFNTALDIFDVGDKVDKLSSDLSPLTGVISPVSLSDVAAGGVPGTREEPRNTGESNAASQLGVRVDVRPSREPLLVMSSQLVHRSEERTVSHSPPGLSNSQGLGFVSPGASSRTFEPLIQVIREGYGQSTGTPKILRSQAAKGLKRGYPELYKDPNIGSFKQYVKQAEVAGVTESFKDSKNSLWIHLKLEPDRVS